MLEENTPWANRAELYIGLLKEAVAFWDYCAERRARINNMTAKNLFQLEGRNAHFSVTGEEGDISNLCQFNWYEWVYYRKGGAGFPLAREILGRVMGPARGEGNEMAQWILKANGNVVPRRTVRPLTQLEQNSETEKEKRSVFTELVGKRWGTSAFPPPEVEVAADKLDYEFSPYEDEDEEPHLIPDFDDPVDSTGHAIDLQPAYDQIINTELMMAQNDVLRPAKVKGRSVGSNGTVHGTWNMEQQPVDQHNLV